MAQTAKERLSILLASCSTAQLQHIYDVLQEMHKRRENEQSRIYEGNS